MLHNFKSGARHRPIIRHGCSRRRHRNGCSSDDLHEFQIRTSAGVKARGVGALGFGRVLRGAKAASVQGLHGTKIEFR